VNQLQERNWWDRNWKWFVPVSCLGVIADINRRTTIRSAAFQKVQQQKKQFRFLNLTIYF
jgi:hypothetical protein